MERRMARLLFFLSLVLGLFWPGRGVSWSAGDEARFRTGLLGPQAPDAEAQARLDRVMPGGGGLLTAMPPWGYRKPPLAEKVDEILALLAFNAPYADDIVNIITQADHYRIYRGTVFGKQGYEQALAHAAGRDAKAKLRAVLKGLVEGEKYYAQAAGLLRVGVYWPEAGLWIELEAQPLIGHPVVVEVRPVTADIIAAGLASGRLKRPLP